MIKYNLICKKCDLNFDSWFATSKEYDKLKRKKLLNCHNCGSSKVEKNLMAPKLINKSFSRKSEKELQKYKKIKKTISEYQYPLLQVLEYLFSKLFHKCLFFSFYHYNELILLHMQSFYPHNQNFF